MYNQILDRYDIVKKCVTVVDSGSDDMSPDKDPENTPPGTVEVEIVDSVPKTFKKAQQLVGKIKAESIVDWNDWGEFVHNGEVVTRSNMVDLVNNVLRKRIHIVPVYDGNVLRISSSASTYL